VSFPHIQRRAFQEQPSEDSGLDQRRIERRDGSVRRSAEAGGRRARDRWIRARDERHQFAGDKLRILASERAARERVAQVFDRQILPRAAHLSVIDADDEDGRDAAAADEKLGRLGDAPRITRERTLRLEQVLAVVEVENRVTIAVEPAPEARRQPDGDAAMGPEVEAGDVVTDEH
jgi:hypothetical protein